ncbi:MAG: hypothetical protein P4K86_04560 [Terracidiphilus sp.]|nr:hypothetical protein [Terracidiphilus sp.]
MRTANLFFMWAILACAFSANGLRAERLCLLAYTDSKACAKVVASEMKSLLSLLCATYIRQAVVKNGSLQDLQAAAECNFSLDGYFLLGKDGKTGIREQE